MLKRVRVTIGTGNAGILYVLKDGVTSASIEHKAATAKATTDVAVVGSAVQVTGGTKARMIAGDMVFVTVFGESEIWDTAYGSGVNGYINRLGGTGSDWEMTDYTHYWGSTDAVDWPDEITTWTQTAGPTLAAPTVTAGVSSASQVITALDASTDAEALITFALAPGSDGSAAISAAGPVVLSR